MASASLCGSRSMRQSVGSSFLEDQPVLASSLTVIPNGIAINTPPETSPEEAAELRAELDLAPDSRVLTAMGRFVEQKGYSFLIEAFAKLQGHLQATTQLLLLGQGPLENRLRDLARSLSVESRVIFGGYRQDIPGFSGSPMS